METKFAIGQTITCDGWRNGFALLENAEDYGGAEFRVTLPMLDVSVPIRVSVSGRVVRWDAPIVNGGVRVRIEFLDDDEAPRVAHGWMSWGEIQNGSAYINRPR